ncbi:response regulator [Chromobacterium alticapitis]|uniref:Response regulatory domain-containing protein n=1 Tax=Chromobacterium alticapitis TaxID=2073169 RepID=A0A2S5DGX1_9NEIS|nr:response regulator [Chromobacterium alticapitis]POZ62261.1 hypothetical protein C2I19_08820 [Chromobacterium alticapitis]
MPKRKFKLMFIDDDPDIRSIFDFAFDQEADMEVRLFASSLDALSAAAAAPPDIILLDVMMPEMDGPNAFKRLKAIPALARTPIVFITAKAQKHEIEKLEQLGAAGVIEKPFQAMELPSRIRALLKRTSGANLPAAGETKKSS